MTAMTTGQGVPVRTASMSESKALMPRVSVPVAPAAGTLTRGINALLSLMEAVLTGTPWPVVMAVILAIAWQLAGFRVFLLTGVAVSYLAILGYWEKSMQTVA